MLAGQIAVYQGNEVCLFPLPYVNCTQGNGSSTFSHCCGTMSDWAGPTAQMAYYAPFSCTRYSGPSGSDNYTFYVSDNKVWTPSGLQWVGFVVMHDDNPPAATHYNQGDLIGHTGTAGFVTGDHVHLDQAFTQTPSLADSGMTCAGSGTRCWYVPGGVQPDRCYYLTGDETIVSQGQFNIPVYDGSVTPGGDGDGNLLWFILGLAAGRNKRRGGGS